MNAVYDTRSVNDILNDKAFADNTPPKRNTNNDFEGFAGLAILFLDVLLTPRYATIEFVTATRADQLRTLIQQGKRLRIEEMRSVLQVHQEKDKAGNWSYIGVERIAELIDLPVVTVSKAVKRFWFF